MCARDELVYLYFIYYNKLCIIHSAERNENIYIYAYIYYKYVYNVTTVER